MAALQQQCLLPQDTIIDAHLAMHWELLCAVHRFVARTISVILMLQLEDLFQLVPQVNLPGNINRANWSHRIPLELEEWWADERIESFTKCLQQERGDY